MEGLMTKLLVVEDAPDLRDMMTSYLRNAGFDVQATAYGEESLRLADEFRPQAVILDIGLPDLDGISVAARLRGSHPELGIILVTVSNDDFDRVSALEIGADIFITKPVNLRVLLAQVRSLLRRRPQVQAASGFITVGGFQVDLMRRRILSAANAEVALTAGEFALLIPMIELRGKPVPRHDLLACLRPIGDAEVIDPRTVDVLIGRLRRKLEHNPNRPRLIQTVYGKGYRLADENELDL